MTIKKPLLSETERMARVITKCFSKATLENAALEMQIQIQPGTDIFRSLVISGKATDFDDAVLITARHLDAHTYPTNDPDADLSDGKIERRVIRRDR